MTHLTPSDVASFRARTLDRERIESIGAHVRECEQCARLVFADPGVMRSAQSAWTPEADLGGRASRPHAAGILPDAMPPGATPGGGGRDARPPWRIALAAAAVIGLLIVAALWLRKDAPREARTPPSPTPRIAPDRVIHDGAVAITLDANGSLQNVSAPRREWNDLVASALRSGSPSAADRRDLLGTGEILRGDGPQARVKLIEPVARVVESDTPRFEWSGDAGARYRVIVARDSAVVARSELLSAESWTPTAPLPRGETYAWQLLVIRGESEQTVPPPDAPPARFHVLSQPEAQEMRDARATGSRLVTGLVASKLGLDDVAARELRAFASQHRDLAAASRLAAHYDRPAPTTTKPDQ